MSLTRIVQHIFPLGLVLVFALGSTACVTSGRGDKMESDITKLQQELETYRAQSEADRENLTKTLGNAKTEIDKLEKVLAQAKTFLSQNNADLGAQVNLLRQEVARLQGAMDLLKKEVERLGKDYDLFKQDVVKRFENTGASLPKDADGLYQAANNFFEAGRWPFARVAFEKFAKDYPRDKRAAKANFLVGESYMAQQLYFEASRAYTKVITEYDRSKSVGDATFRAGDALLAMGECGKAVLVYEDAIGRYRRSSYRKETRSKLRDLRKRDDCN